MVAVEIRLIGYVVGLYVCFIYWGYLQEKLTSTEYSTLHTGETLRWDYPFALNLLMAISAVALAATAEFFTSDNKKVQPLAFARAAMTCAIASPLGYAALKYISFPLMILTKSSKPVPVMIIGVLFFRKKYTWYKYLSVGLLCTGCVLFSSAKANNKGTNSYPLAEQLFGILLVGINLFLDGYTNNEQDMLFKMQHASGPQMMKYINIWQVLYLFIYLSFFWLFSGESSELEGAVRTWILCPQVRYDIFLFCICAALGQILIFAVMKEFGSLVWVTVSITRKLFTILLSVFAFNHSLVFMQWLGIAFVFIGMGIDVVMNYINKDTTSKHGKKA